ncbi:unnamed protein product [Rhizopus stolonifer]
MEFNQDMNDDACMKLSRIINYVESNRFSKDDAEIDLLMLGKILNPFERPLVWGIKTEMRKLPLMPIKTKKSLGECELFTMYFEPILSALLSDPDKSVMLRWSKAGKCALMPLFPRYANMILDQAMGMAKSS